MPEPVTIIAGIIKLAHLLAPKLGAKVGVKAVGKMGSQMVHQSATAAGKTLFTVGHNVAVSAATASTVAASLTVLAGGGVAARHLAKAYYKEMITEELQAKGHPTLKTGATDEDGPPRNGDARARLRDLLMLTPDMSEDMVEMLIQVAALIAGNYVATKQAEFKAEESSWIAKGPHVPQLPHEIANTALDGMRVCGDTSCHCGNLDSTPESSFFYSGCKVCGHAGDFHMFGLPVSSLYFKAPEAELFALLFALAVETYRDLGHKSVWRTMKRETKEIETCTVGSCNCGDFNWEKGSECQCGHSHGQHKRTGDWYFIIRAMMAMVLEELAE